MRRVHGFVLLFCCAGASALAAPVRPGGSPPAPTANLDGVAHDYADRLFRLVGQIEVQYVRPVERAALVEAALAGLYQAAGRPAPGNLAEEARRVKTDVDLVNLLMTVRKNLAAHAGAALDNGNDLLASAHALTRILDPYSTLVTPEENQKSAPFDSMLVGTGIELAESPEAATQRVQAILAGSPAQRADIRPGDEITHVNDKEVKGLPSLQVQTLLDAPGSTEAVIEAALAENVTLTFVRRNQEPRKVEIERRRFRPETVHGVIRGNDNRWDFYADRKNKLAHVRIARLSRGTAEELREVLTALREDGVRGLVLDLRWCPGGYLDESLRVAEMFLGPAVLATVKSRRDGETTYRNERNGSVIDVPLVVLVNSETSGGAELIAAALQDQKRGRVAGQRTRGKGSIQVQVVLGPNLTFKITSGTFVRASGKSLHRFADSKPADDWGVRPETDLELRLSSDLSQRLQTWWQEQTQRSGASRQVLPLDDPSNDAPRQLALQALLRQLATVRAKGE